jgi:triphosphoribosyl-dephospho-CoA synthase
VILEGTRPMTDPTAKDVTYRPLSIGQCATLATIIEATAPKPGNVHRGADYEDSSYPDFVLAAVAIGPIMEEAVRLPLGEVVLAAVEATRAMVNTNVNLGTILLVAPLAKVPRTTAISTGIVDVLASTTRQDARDVYEAIARARPGGLGQVAEADIAAQPPDDLIAAMRLAADRDMVARQYAENFRQLWETVVPWLSAATTTWDLNSAIVRLHLQLMNEFPDSLIARRLGAAMAQESAARAGKVLDLGSPGEVNYERGLAELDFWLRSDGHRRNPGTTADLIAAGLFVALRDGMIKPPLRLANPFTC